MYQQNADRFDFSNVLALSQSLNFLMLLFYKKIIKNYKCAIHINITFDHSQINKLKLYYESFKRHQSPQ